VTVEASSSYQTWHGLTGGTPVGHLVDFYANDDELVGRVSAYLAGALGPGQAAVLVATPSHCAAIAQALEDSGWDLAQARSTGTWVVVDAGELLCRLSTEGRVDATKFHLTVAPLLRSLAEGGHRVRVYGEMVDLLWQAGDVSGAMDLESWWNGLSHELAFSLYCGYGVGTAEDGPTGRPGTGLGALEAICNLHTEVAGGHIGAAGDALPSAFAEFAPVPTAAKAARTFLRDVLEAWGLASCCDVGEVVVTELTTNALLHARSPFRVVVALSANAVRISVHDRDPVLPERAETSTGATSGRGLALVEGLSVNWGCGHRVDGKEVWAEISS
jgi:anti-sigma regulatory factor (Ser/Thr protein kinase)